MTRARQGLAVLLAPALLAAGIAAAEPPPAPPYPPPPPVYRRPPPPPPPPPYGPPRVAPPPPLSPVMRVLYAPFYAAGLVVRYGVYYVIVAPLEVFGRAATYGAKGGVERRSSPPEEDDS